MKEEIISLAKELIKIPSVSGNINSNQEALECAQKFLDNSIKPRVFKHNKVTSFLWSNGKNKLTPKLLLSAHLDVVDVGENKKLFAPVVEGNKLSGRGAGDMKGQAAVLLWCFKNAISENPRADIALLLTTDEEVGGFNGARFVIESGLKPDIVFLPDGGEDFSVVDSEKAPHHFILKTTGPGGHASRAFKIDNPVNRISAFYQEVRKVFSVASSKKPWASTFEMTTIQTDNKSKNVIPMEVVASFSWRWPLEQIKFDLGRRKILAIAEKYQCKVILEEGWGEGTLIDKNSPDVKTWKKIIEKNLGRRIKFSQSHGASDARHFFNNKKYGSKNIIITSPKTGGHHTDTEWIAIDSLIMMGNALNEFIVQVT